MYYSMHGCIISASTLSDVVMIMHAGINFSNDKLLQSRLFSYADAQRYRIGVNYQDLPVNRPQCPFHENNYEGQMQVRTHALTFLGVLALVTQC